MCSCVRRALLNTDPECVKRKNQLDTQKLWSIMTQTMTEQAVLSKESERDHIIKILREAKGNKKLAAELLQISRGTLYRRLRAFGLEHLVRDPLHGLDAE